MSNKKRTCEKCSKEFHYNSIYRHRKECSVGGRSSPCKCNFHTTANIFYSKQFFCFFFAAHGCKECGKKFMRKSQLNVHVNVVHKKMYDACPHCHVLLHPNAVKRHVQRNCAVAQKKSMYKKVN